MCKLIVENRNCKMLDQQFINQIEILDYLQQCNLLIPGFEKAIAFYKHPVYKDIRTAISVDGTHQLRDISSNSLLIDDKIMRLRQQKSGAQWVEEKDIPFEHNNSETPFQKKVFDEYRHYILLLRTLSNVDQRQDLLFIYFRPNASNFGIRNSTDTLTTDQKSIIASLLSNTFVVYHSQRIKFASENQQLREDNRLMGSQIKEIQFNYLQQQQTQSKQISRFIIEKLNEQALLLKLNLQLSAEAQNYIHEYQGPIAPITQAAAKTVSMAYRIQNPPQGGILKIEDYFLRPYFNNSELLKETDTSIETMVDSIYSRTVRLLNRLENAAKKVQSQGNTLTGTALGQAMENPISAPAISDALKKHKKFIKTLCNEYPQEWLTIRKSFRPIINTLSA